MIEETKKADRAEQDAAAAELSEQDLDKVAGGWKFEMLPMIPAPPMQPIPVDDPPLAPIKIRMS